MLGKFTDLFLHKFGLQAHQFCKILRLAHLGPESMRVSDVFLSIAFYFLAYIGAARWHRSNGLKEAPNNL